MCVWEFVCVVYLFASGRERVLFFSSSHLQGEWGGQGGPAGAEQSSVGWRGVG